MAQAPASDRPVWIDWVVLGLFAAVVFLFGALVVYRSAYRPIRHTDFEVYARAGWAMRTGRDVYDITDARGLHYCYPPTFAVLMTPFADPPAGSDHSGYLPFACSIAIWYALSVISLFAAVHILAKAVERRMGIRVGSRRWVYLRMGPVLITLPSIGNTLSHGQTNLLMLLLLCAMIAAAVLGRSARAGAWLSGAVALKMIPAFLGLLALRRRDAKWVLGGAAGLLLFLVGVPALLLGPVGAVRANLKFLDVMVHPALATAEKSDRALEMFTVLKTDNQSIQAVLHAWQYWKDPKTPAEPNGPTRAVHWLLGGLLTAITLIAARGRGLRGNDLVLFAGALTVVMLLISPMCHMHYYCLALPLVLGLLHHSWRESGDLKIGWPLMTFLVLNVLGAAFPLIFESFRNLGFVPLTTLPLWAMAVRLLGQQRFENAAILPFSAARRERRERRAAA